MERLIKQFGYQGYYCFFVLVGLCAELISDGHEFPLVFDELMLRRNLRLKKLKLSSFLGLMQLEFSFNYIRHEDKVHITWVNILKFLGSYKKDGPNKRKEKEIKENININTSNEVQKENDQIPSAKKVSKKTKRRIETFDVENLAELINIIPDGYMLKWEAMFPNAETAQKHIGEAIRWNLMPEKRAQKKAYPRSKDGWRSFIDRWLTREINRESQKTNSRPNPKTFDQIRTENNNKTYHELIDFINERDVKREVN